MTNEYKEIENNSSSNSSIFQESFCSECKKEISVDQNQDENMLNNKTFCSTCKNEVVADEAHNGGILMKFFHEKIICFKCRNKTDENKNQNSKEIEKHDSDTENIINELFAEALDDNDELSQTTQSLSQISLGYIGDREENQSNIPTHVEEQNYLPNEIHINEDNYNCVVNDVLFFNNEDDKLNKLEVGEKNLAFQNCDDNATDNIFDNLNNEPQKIFFCDQEVQTKNESLNKENKLPLWDPEFPSGAELEQIDNAVNEATITSASKCKRKLNFDDFESNFRASKKFKDVSKSNCNSIISVKLNREKHLADLANNLYEVSSYLEDIGKAMTVKEPNNKTSIKIPAPPKIVGYDVQFDCLNQSRYSKLPINIENNDSNKSNASNESLNSRRVKTSKKVTYSALTLKNTKTTNNNKGVGVPKKSFYQTTLKEAFSYGKENKNIKSIGSKKSVNQINSASIVNYNRDDKSLDSTSMYNFNPLHSSTLAKKK